MATLSTAHATSTLTPPSSSHDRDPHAWEPEDIQDKSILSHDNDASYLSGHIDDDGSRRKPSPVSTNPKQDKENGSRSPIMVDDSTPAETRLAAAPRAQSRTSERRSRERNADNNNTMSKTEEDKWIHRDKLAKIENAELQAAGFVLPKPRAASRRRDRSEHSHRHDKTGSRKNSVTAESRPTEIEVPEWDLRLPEEIMEETDAGYWESPLNNGKGSRIPVAKISPAPIPHDFLDRDAPIGRSKSFEPDLDSARKPRSRSGSTKTNNDSYQTSSSMPPTTRRGVGESPRKTSATRKSSVPPRRSSSRPKTRGGNRDSSGTQPSMRSGEYTLSNNTSITSSNKQPEGEPPWMISAYRPDPRLPPEEQLLPTVARRLQQERWEKEGKFGNVYDKDFRPLNDEGFLKPPEPIVATGNDAEGEPEDEGQDDNMDDQWPLRSADVQRSGIVRSNSYSTMPKISDKSPGSPSASPRGNGSTMSRPGTAQQHQEEPQQQHMQESEQPQQQQQQQQQQQTELEKDKEAGCGCCVVM